MNKSLRVPWLVLFCAAVLMGSAPAFAGGKILVYSPWKDEIMEKFGEILEKEKGTQT